MDKFYKIMVTTNRRVQPLHPTFQTVNLLFGEPIMSHQIKLTQNQTTIIDTEDFERVSKYKWCASKRKSNKTKFDAMTKVKLPSGKKQTLLLHRFLLNCPKGQQVDHINGDTLDNQKENLRIASQAENNRNCKARANNRTGYKGVCFISSVGKFQAQIVCNRKIYYLGRFETAISAAKAYNEKAVELHGEFAALNKI